MQEGMFRQWLVEQGFQNDRVVGDHMSRCRRIEKEMHVDLDAEFNRDRGVDLMDRLSYSTADEAAGVTTPIQFNGNAKNGMAIIKGSAKKYMEFKSR